MQVECIAVCRRLRADDGFIRTLSRNLPTILLRLPASRSKASKRPAEASAPQCKNAVHRKRDPLGRFEDEGVSTGNRIRQKPKWDHRREIERCDGCNHAKWLSHHGLVNTRSHVFQVVALHEDRDAAPPRRSQSLASVRLETQSGSCHSPIEPPQTAVASG
jgi:hypothetical protein